LCVTIHIDEPIRVDGRRNVEWTLPGVTAVGGAMEDQVLRNAVGPDFLERERTIDEGARADVFDIGIAKYLRKTLTGDGVGSRTGKLPANDNRHPSIVGIREAGDRYRVSGEAAKIVVGNHHVLPCRIDGDAGF